MQIAGCLRRWLIFQIKLQSLLSPNALAENMNQYTVRKSLLEFVTLIFVNLLPLEVLVYEELKNARVHKHKVKNLLII